MVLEKILRVPWTARRSNQSTLKEISPGISLDKCHMQNTRSRDRRNVWWKAYWFTLMMVGLELF